MATAGESRVPPDGARHLPLREIDSMAQIGATKIADPARKFLMGDETICAATGVDPTPSIFLVGYCTGAPSMRKIRILHLGSFFHFANSAVT